MVCTFAGVIASFVNALEEDGRDGSCSANGEKEKMAGRRECFYLFMRLLLSIIFVDFTWRCIMIVYGWHFLLPSLLFSLARSSLGL